MKTLIFAGGSGARVLEAVLHLCAAGLGPANLRTFVIDPDDSNGNGDKTGKLVDRYLKCQEAFQMQHAAASSNGAEAPPSFFGTRLDLLNHDNQLEIWRPVDPDQQFKDLLNFTGLSSVQRDVVKLLLTDEELKMNMKRGFRGHPALGAAALALLPLYQNDELWAQFSNAIQQDLAQGEAKVVIVGSIFGGTGASAIHPLVRYLRKLPQQNQEKLKVAAVALVPYFSFSSADAGQEELDENVTAAQSEWFPLASRSAAEYYKHLQNHDDWPFDALYWLGDDSPAKVSYSTGGPRQANPAHFIDLLAAFACLDFLAETPSAPTCYYAGPEESNPSGLNVLTWEDIPMSALERNKVRTALQQFQLVGAAHLSFYHPLLTNEQLTRLPYCVPWYLDRFTGHDETLQGEQNQKNLALLTNYFSQDYFQWWHEIHSAVNDRVRLFNRMSWVAENKAPVKIQRDRLANLLYPDQATAHGLDPVDVLFSEMDRAAKTVSGADTLSKLYFSILAHASQEFVRKQAIGGKDGVA
jgi:hypothetical protein